MSDLSEFLSGSSENDVYKEKQRIIEQADKSLSSSEVRKKEIELFTPKDLLTFFKWGDVTTYFDAVKIYFSCKEYYGLFRKHFKVSEYLEANTYHIEHLIAFLVALEKGYLKVEVEDDNIVLECVKPFKVGMTNG